jgi:hypothetical protein
MWNEAAVAPQGASEAGRINDAIHAAYDAWKAAEAAARRMEHEVGETWLRYQHGLGAGPSRGVLRELACLRQESRDQLRHAIRLLHEAGYIQPATIASLKAASAH